MYFEIRTLSLSINIVIMAIILAVCGQQTHEKNIFRTFQRLWCLIISCLTFLVILVLFLRLRLFLEELLYIKSDYNGNFLTVAKASFNFNVPSWILVAVTFFSFLMFTINGIVNTKEIILSNLLATALALSFSLLLLYTVDIMDCHVRKSELIFSSGGLDPGSAMAGSFFYGYLKIVLPSSGGSERQGILRSLERYEDDQDVTVPMKKLFILIPASSYIPPNLKEISNGWLQPVKKLETITLDRAGAIARTYHNTVYKLYPKGPDEPTSRNIYLAVEGATPLKTFSEVQDKSHRYAPLYKEFNREIVRNFYVTLKNLLNDNPDCRDYCELVYYEDMIDGIRQNPADVLLEILNRNSNETLSR